MKKGKGFTLVELMIAMAVGLVILSGIYIAVNTTQKHSVAIERKVVAQQDVKPALDIMALEIGMASYNPSAVTGIWVIPTGDCRTPSVNQVYRGIQEATGNSIAIEMDIATGGDGDGALDDANEVIRYTYEIADQYISRTSSTATACGTAQPFFGDTVASGMPRTGKIINNTLGIPVFRYYDSSGAEIAAGGLPANIPNIRRIDIVLAVETESIDTKKNEPRKIIYSTSVIPRNHAIQ
jgi:prepilin-type N-terminal cleavage/methylation domain-containing protein